MTVYIGQTFRTGRSKQWPFLHAAHLFSDDLEELHTLAAGIGLKKAWFQALASTPHYDVTKNMRKAAIQAGALPLTMREEGRKLREMRESHQRSAKNATNSEIVCKTVKSCG